MSSEQPAITICLPIGDRRMSLAFYRDGVGLEPFGEIAEDGAPEPLQFELAGGCRLMLIPSVGFGWLIGDREVAGRNQRECVVTLGPETNAEVDAVVARAVDAGARLVTEPGAQPWGYVGAFADPDGHVWMVRSQASEG